MNNTNNDLGITRAIEFGLQRGGNELSSAFWFLIGWLGGGSSLATRELIETFRARVTGQQESEE